VLDSPDPRVKAAVDRARRVAGRGVALVIQGESGVGKEVLARALHASGPRAAGGFVVVQASALPTTLIEAELFGHDGGAFTGAREQGTPGRVRQADDGTLFLDDVAELPQSAQAALLRVLQDRAVQPLGSAQAVAVDFDLVCATREPLAAAVQAGRLREDLYYRLNGLTVTLPPLRQRQDRDALLHTLLAEAAEGRPLTLAPDLQAALLAHDWPGNLRQLAQALRTACALLDDGAATIGWAQLSDDLVEALRAG
jgi:transcriptional regulator of acetoin/glycerol metabolism